MVTNTSRDRKVLAARGSTKVRTAESMVALTTTTAPTTSRPRRPRKTASIAAAG